MLAMSHVAPGAPVGQASAALHTVLSQLSFTTDIVEEDQSRKPGSVWNGLFCFSFEDDDIDLFFDAHQSLRTYNESSDDCSSLVSVVEQIRGGGGRGEDGDGDNNDKKSQEMIFQNSPGPVIAESASPTLNTGGERLESQPGEKEAQPEQNGRSGHFEPLPAPPPPEELPVRFLRAGKGDAEEGQRRYAATLEWRKENGIDHILTDAHPDFDLIKKHYPHYYHLRGRDGEPVFFEQPPKTNLQAMKDGGVVLEGLLRHYAMVTEFQWQCVEKDDFARSITVLDLEGMRMMDFVGECVEYVRRCSEFTGQHYPERAGFVYVINVPGWFAMVWNVVKPWVDEVTLKKINILRGKKEIFEALLEKIPIENIPPEYGGESVPLGESPEEHLLRDLVHHNNAVAHGDHSCGGRAVDPPCRFCSFAPARSY